MVLVPRRSRDKLVGCAQNMEQCCGRGAAATPTNADLHSGRYNVARAATWKLFKRLGLTWLCCGICVGSSALAIARTGADEQDCSHGPQSPFRTDNGTAARGRLDHGGLLSGCGRHLHGRAPAASCYDAGTLQSSSRRDFGALGAALLVGTSPVYYVRRRRLTD